METDYKQKYEEALHLAKSYYGKGQNEFLDTLFPELRESDSGDERTRKALLKLVSNDKTAGYTGFYEENGITCDDAIAWLEKQKESLHISETCKENANSFTDEDERIKKKIVSAICYYRNDGCISEYEFAVCRSWLEKQKEQKPVEYLSKRKVYDIMNKLTELSTSDLIPTKSEEYVKIHEITSDVRSLLDYPIEQKPAEKPINWTELTWKDIVELECIINKVNYEFRNGIGQESFGKEVLEQFREYKGDEYLDEIEQYSVEWSEEDEQKYQSIRAILLEDTTKKIGKRTYGDVLEWYESKGKGRFTQLKQEWSEEDEKRIKQLIYDTEFIKAHYKKRKEELGEQFNNVLIEDCDEQIAWLKSLRPDSYKNCNSRWKPSEEQMEALEKVLHRCPETLDTDKAKVLWGLFDQLKKLK